MFLYVFVPPYPLPSTLDPPPSDTCKQFWPNRLAEWYRDIETEGRRHGGGWTKRKAEERTREGDTLKL